MQEYPTTFGFVQNGTTANMQTTTIGFSVQTRSALSASPSLREGVQQKAGDVASRLPSHAPAQPDSVSKDQKVSTVGWNGLFEMSRNSGTAGVVGSSQKVGRTWGALWSHVSAVNASDGPMFPMQTPEPGQTKQNQIEVCATAHTNPAIRRLVKSVIRGLTACQEPDKTADGRGGTYFFCNENGRKVAIMKPCDEEPLAPNNPKVQLQCR